MKNIHIIPTVQPSRLVKIKDTFFLTNTDDIPGGTFYNIYITSDEEIGEGDWYLDTTVNVIFKNDKLFLNGTGYKKIILSTNQELIADGVQAIDDEFLLWFVKNPACEFVDVKTRELSWGKRKYNDYKIIIPLPTAKELFYKMLEENEECTSTEMMIEFAKLHVEAALKESSGKLYDTYHTVCENGTVKGVFRTQQEALNLANHLNETTDLYHDWNRVVRLGGGMSKDTILNSYPLDNIK
jgi:hypothetical protein